MPEQPAQSAQTVTITLEAPYEGWTATLDADPDWGFFEALDSNSLSTISGAIAEQLRDWTFIARNGDALPATRAGVTRAPAGAIRQLIRLYAAHFRALPNTAAGA